MHWQLSAPAKVNLLLRLNGPRPDGFTALQSLVWKVNWCDQLHLSYMAGPSSSVELACNWPVLTQVPEDNLVMKAHRLFWESVGGSPSGQFQWTLTKDIPHQAGLGGGSSDAATALLLLNQARTALLQKPSLPLSDLIPLGAQLGSDIALFLHPQPLVWMTGRGEQCQPFETEWTPPGHCLIVKPIQLSISTAIAFQRVHEEQRWSLPVDFASIHPGEWLLWSVNDFEALLFSHYPALVDLAERLKTLGAFHTLLCGSGSAMVAWFDQQPETSEINSILPSDQFRWRWVPS